jgi:coatomer subunit alpha
VLPLIPRNLESITAAEVTAGKTAVKGNKLDQGLATFKRILQLLMVNAVETANEFDEVGFEFLKTKLY